ncbi:MAG: class I tRNA ligase family protein, partial [Phycisphaerales bacterium]|nr:class I tRNA ligase family protein [Phycisphaerales bacterium]
GKRLVNWDPVTRTALADDEVEMKEVAGQFCYLRYPLTHLDGVAAGQPVTWSELAARGYPVPADSAHGDDEQAWVTVATTRPETYLGDTAVAVNPSDPRAAALAGLGAQLPLVGRVIPILHDDYVVLPDPESDDPKARFATGFLKVTPAHDPNDWELGQRHQLPIINVMAEDGSISDQHGWDDVGDAHLFVGLSREEARKKVLHEFEARGLLEEIRPYTHSVGHSYRSHVPIEPWLSDQWYVKVTDDRLRGAALRAMAPEQRTSDIFRARPDNPDDGQLHFHPARYARTFEVWHEGLRDWCISRQLWWGHQIPVWWAPEGAAASLPPGLHSDDERFSLRQFDDRVCVCIRLEEDGELVSLFESAGWRRDPDVLDTWFSSGLWPLNTMGWPRPGAETAGLLEAFNPTSALFTAREIITLWVSRMVMFNRYFLSPDGGETPGRLPFRDVFIHAMIQDGEGRKMSKSLGNGVDPLDIIASHGCDAMRFVLGQMTTQTQDVRMPVERDAETGRNTSPRFDIGRNFCTKLWNATRFAMMTLDQSETKPGHNVDFTQLTVVDQWMLSRLAGAIETVNAALERYEFSAYAQIMYDLLWRDFCDW